MGKLLSSIRNLRKNQTEAELILWEAVREFRFKGYAFRRQHPVCKVQYNSAFYYFIVDFICLKAKLEVEVDGPYHESQKEYDEARQMVIENQGLYVLRYTNDQVKYELGQVVEEIERVAKERVQTLYGEDEVL